MAETLEQEPMAKAGRPKGEHEEGTVKVDKPIATQAKLVANHRGISVREYLSAILRSLVGRDYLRMTKELEKAEEEAAKEADEEEPPKKERKGKK